MSFPLEEKETPRSHSHHTTLQYNHFGGMAESISGWVGPPPPPPPLHIFLPIDLPPRHSSGGKRFPPPYLPLLKRPTRTRGPEEPYGGGGGLPLPTPPVAFAGSRSNWSPRCHNARKKNLLYCGQQEFPRTLRRDLIFSLHPLSLSLDNQIRTLSGATLFARDFYFQVFLAKLIHLESVSC